MNENDKPRFLQIMTGLAEDCSSKLSKEGLSLKFKALSGYSIEQVEAGVLRVMRENIYNKMPTTGTIINAIEGTADDRAEKQWSIVVKRIGDTGAYGTPRFLDAVTHDLVFNRFGWAKLCQTNQSDLDFIGRDFKKAYIQRKNSIVFCNTAVEGPSRKNEITQALKTITQSLSWGQNGSLR
jgi:hypothetical protein